MTLPKGASVVVPVVICICISYSMTSLAISRYKEVYGYNPWCHESSITALIGLLVGGAIKFLTGSAVEFDNDVFFYVVLPPIIFSAGLSLKKKMFFRYISLITLFGVMGTVINFSLITAVAYHATRMFDFRDNIFDRPVNLSWEHAMLLAAVLSGTDEVSALSLMPMKEFPRLGALIFGEGVLNDAISIVLFHVLISKHVTDDSNRASPIQELAVKLAVEVTIEVFFSFLIGVSCGLVNARLLKSLTYLREHPIHQTVLLMLFAYLAYTIAESVGVSGILTLFVTAVTQGHYSWHSLSKPAQVATKINSVALSDIAEGFAFSYVGLSMWEYVDDGFHIQFSLFILTVVILSRLITILVLCFICKHSCTGFNMPFSEQLGFTLGGIVRGCLCWAQILQINEHRMLVTTTLLIVMTTSLGGGFLLPMIIPRLGLKSLIQEPRVSENQVQGPGQMDGSNQGQGQNQRREPLLKRSYKSHPRSMSTASHVRTERGKRRFSVYCFNNHAEAEDDLYASTTNSPHYSADEKALERPRGLSGHNLHERIRALDSIDTDDSEDRSYRSQADSSTIATHDRSALSVECSRKTKLNLESKGLGSLLSIPQVRLSKDHPPDKPTANKRPVDGRAGKSRGHIGGGLGSVSALSKTVRGHMDSRYVSKTHTDSSRCERERQRDRDRRRDEEQAVEENEESWDEDEMQREENEREDRGDYSVDGSDIDNLNALNDEMASGDQLCAMASHQVVLDSIYGTGTESLASSSASPRTDNSRFNRTYWDGTHTAYVHDSPYTPRRDDAHIELTEATGRASCISSLSTSGKESDFEPSALYPVLSHNPQTHTPLCTGSSSSGSTFSSSWGDIHKYKKTDSSSCSKFLPRSVDRLEPLIEGRGLRAQSKREKPRLSGHKGLELQIPELLEGNMRGIGSSVQRVYKTASAFVNWVNFDEEYLKPLFGGSRREYTSIPEELLTPTR